MQDTPTARPKTDFARRRRSAATRIERDLWHQLRDRRLAGLKFRREAPIGPYVVDFICPSARLVVEADGPLHADAEQKRRDDRRARWLESAGYRVLRFSEDEILSDLARVLERIETALLERSSNIGRHPG
ncbi:endonuclease domain-containing protein [Afifella sp. IM 167]|uniref:endonuclease domain-containing protein n=1 Tax=Afifella sp. IM 167 TaxID=2033586 RepID=UPI001CCC3AA6|nr:endonuclease domain-containing protein [Afifella sp. IM 167]